MPPAQSVAPRGVGIGPWEPLTCGCRALAMASGAIHTGPTCRAAYGMGQSMGIHWSQRAPRPQGTFWLLSISRTYPRSPRRFLTTEFRSRIASWSRCSGRGVDVESKGAQSRYAACVTGTRQTLRYGKPRAGAKLARGQSCICGDANLSGPMLGQP